MKKLTTKIMMAVLSLTLVLTGVNFVPSITGFGITEVQAAAKQTKMYVKKDGVKVYAKRSEDSEVLKTLKQYKLVTMLGSADDDGWVKIKYAEGKKGFVKRSKLKKSNVLFPVAKRGRNKIITAANKYGFTDVIQDEIATGDVVDVAYGAGCKAITYYVVSNDKYKFWIKGFAYHYFNIYDSVRDSLSYDIVIYDDTGEEISYGEYQFINADEVTKVLKKYR